MRDDLSSPWRRALREVALAPALFVVLAAVVVVSLLVGVGPAGSALSLKNGKFAYTAGSPASIWVMNANGSGRKVLTPHYANAVIAREDSEPAWSPNGTEIAFTRSRQTTGLHGAPEPTTEIDVMNADGSSQTRLTRTTKNDHSPTWSPDGKKIAFVRSPPFDETPNPGSYPPGEIWVMNANGSGQTQLTHVVLDACNKDTNIDASQPAWSPDGTKIAFTSVSANYPCNYQIHVMNADGSAQRQLTGTNGPDDAPNASYPAWSPDGTKIVFQSETPGTLHDGNVEVYVMNPDGSGQTRLTKNDGFCPYRCPNGETHGQPAWSPDGTKIAFTRNIPPKTIDQARLFDLFVMNADGSGQKLVQHQIVDRVDWGPVPSGAANPLPRPPLRLMGHPSLTLRCLRGDLHALVAPPPGIDFVQFYFNGINLQEGAPHIYNSPPFETSYPGSRLPRTTWIVKAIVSVESESSVAKLVLTKRHAPHC